MTQTKTMQDLKFSLAVISAQAKTLEPGLEFESDLKPSLAVPGPEKIIKDNPLESSLNSSHNSPLQTVVNVYKNYVPVALVAADAVGFLDFCQV